jgi:ribonuclease HI
MVHIYTDGSSLNNPGPSGWACYMELNMIGWLLSGGVEHSTNNRMELQAVIEAINFLGVESVNEEVVIYTDSLLTMNCGKGIWKRKSNLDLWENYEKIIKGKNIKWVWVKAHNGNTFNELVDSQARSEANMFNLQKGN